MAFYTRGDRNFGVDFRGGDLVTLSAPNKIDVGQVRGALKPIGFADASIQESAQGGKSYITVRTPLQTSDKVEHQMRQPDAGDRASRLYQRIGQDEPPPQLAIDRHHKADRWVEVRPR